MPLMPLAMRSLLPEQMDDTTLDPAEFGLVLGDLAVVNRWTLAARPTLAFLDRSVGARRRFRLLDVGYGQGDMLRSIAKWAKRRGIEAELIGVDRDARSAPAARAATPADLRIEFRTGDYRDFAEPYDCIVSSLVAHHMTDYELGRFIAFMERTARAGWLINDLHRQRVAQLLFCALAPALRVHPIVRSDGMLSIARSFRDDDWRRILRGAGIARADARLLHYFPFRLCVERLF